MGKGVHVVDLPGIGRRYDMDLGGDNRVSVVQRKDGTRDLYVFAAGAADPVAVFELSDEQARKLGAVLTSTYFGD